MLIIGDSLDAARDGCRAGWLVVTRLCDDDDNDNNDDVDDAGGVVTDSECDVSTAESVATVVDDEGDDVITDLTNWSALLFFTGGGSSVS